jgi:hypothetical protein
MRIVWLQTHTVIRSNFYFSTATLLDEGAALSSFTYIAIVVCYASYMRGSMENIYLYHPSQRLSRGFPSTFNYVTFYDPYFKSFYSHPYFVTYFTSLRADKL